MEEVFMLTSVGLGRVAYSIVDMTLDGGMGDLVSGSAGVMFNSDMTEKMIAIPGDSCNVWLMLHKRDSTQFYAYNITASGISSTPIVSNVGTFVGPNCYLLGDMKCSHDRQSIVTTSHQAGPSPFWGIELFDFNPATGIVSNCRVLDLNPSPGGSYSSEFSPDNSKLYSDDGEVYQWDLSLPTTAAIVASKTLLSTTGGMAMRLGPDGKIYLSGGAAWLHCINNPNAAVGACGYVPYALSVFPDSVRLGLPNLIWNAQPIIGPSLICVGASTTFGETSAGGTWSSSNTSVAIAGSSSGVITGISPGTTIISYTMPGALPTSRIITVVTGVTVPGTAICLGNMSTLSASIGGGTWTSGSSTIAPIGSLTGIVTGVAAGTSVITYDRGPGCLTATTIVTVNGIPVAGSTVCTGSSLSLSSGSPGGTWTSSYSSIATVGFASGIVTGFVPGTTIISYVSPAGCIEITNVTVDATPTPIAGKLNLCEGFSTMLTCTPSGGTWSSSAPVATITSSGSVVGASPGTATISYMLPGGCFSTVTVTINALPAPIVGPISVAVGSSITLADATVGGSWSSGDTIKGKVNSAGKVNGLGLGTVIIYYTLPTGCKQSVTLTIVKSISVEGLYKTVKPSLYPNPSTNEITLNTEHPTFSSFTIYNAIGQEVATSEINSHEMKVNVKEFAPGEYQVVLKGEGVKEVLRFMKW